MRVPALTIASIALCSGLAAAAGLLTHAEIAPYLQPQRMVDVGGHKLNLYCAGQGSPTVVLEAGEGEDMVTWRNVQPKVATFTRVCAYDRAGMGFSDGGPLPRDASAMVTDLHALLNNAGLQPPFILVGHSIAGLYTPLYADRYPHDVAGMVLVDPSFPNQTQVLEEASPTMKRFDSAAPNAYQVCYEAALHGDLTSGSDKYALCGFPANAPEVARARCKQKGPAFCELLKVQTAQIRRPAFWVDLGSEDAASNGEDSAEDIKEQRSYGAMPLIVLTAANDTGGPSPIPTAKMRAIEQVWTAGHDRIAHLSSLGVNFVVSHSGHFIQLDQPDNVFSAIAKVVSQVRSGTVATVPLIYLHHEVFIRARVGASGPYNFLLDTDTTPSAIDSGLARRLELRPRGPSGHGSGVGSGHSLIVPVTIPDISVGTLHAKNLNTLTTDLSGLSKRLGRRIDGVLGTSFLAGRVTEFNYPCRTISFLNDAPNAPITASFRGDGENVVDTVFINGRRATATFDTGNGGQIFVTGKGIAELGLLSAAKRGKASTSYGFNGSSSVSTGRLGNVRVGAVDLDGSVASFLPSDQSPYDINIGNRSMQRHRVIFDYVRKLITFLGPAPCAQ